MASVTCARCGTENPAEARFCLECGNALAALELRRAREERKVVSVLFADLVGFTSQAERLDPEEVRAILQPYHARLRSELERFGGTVEKFIGDAVMALFGAPSAHEDDPERAVRSALAIRDSLAADGRLQVRIGITTGEALVALEARPETGEGMAAGDVVNTAARLQAGAPVDGILVDEATYRATARAIEYRPHAAVLARGKAAPVPTWEAVAARARFGVDVRQAARGPLIGRRRELDLLVGALDRAVSEREPQLVTLIGVPGIGKSRLVWELFQHIDRGNELVSWRQGRSLPYAERISFWALGEIVKAEAGILETDSPAEASAKLGRTVAGVVGESEAEWVERHLRPLIGVETGTELRGDHRGEAFAAWRTFLESLSDQRPLVLVLEDLHWADDGLLDFVEDLSDRAADVPLLIVATSRPELLARRPGWSGGKSNALSITLGALSEAETSTLVAGLVEHGLLPDSMRQLVLERAEGNPLYAEEFARLVAERGRIDELPESVHGLVAARLDALSRDEKKLLQDAAVVGKVFWSGALAEMSGRERSEVEDLLHALERKEFVRRQRRSSVAGELEYAFRHVVVRDVGYGQMPRAQRAERHALAARWMESLGRPADLAEVLAQHYLSAIQLARSAGVDVTAYADRARPLLAEAGDRALKLNAFSAAARYYAAALELTSERDPDRPYLLFRCGKALRTAEVRGLEILAEAEALLLAAGDRATAAEAAVLQGELTWDAGDGDRTAEHVERAAARARDLEDSFSKAYVLSDVSRHYMLRDDEPRAIEAGEQAAAIAEAMGFDEILAHALNNIGSARSRTGDPRGIEYLERAIAIADAANSAEAPRAMGNLAAALQAGGEIERARQLWRDAVVRAGALGNMPVERFIRTILAGVEYFDGNWDEALAALDSFIARVESQGSGVQEGEARAFRSLIRFARGDTEGALADGERAVAAGRRARDPQARIPSLGPMIWHLVVLGRHADAGELADELMEIASLTDDVIPETIVALVRLGRHADAERIAAETRPGGWHDAYARIAAGRFAEAAEVCEQLMALPSAAVLRLEAARQLLAEGRTTEAGAQLGLASAFWRRVGATRYMAEAESLAADAGRVLAREGS